MLGYVRPAYLTWEECLERFPRLARVMAWTAILSQSEAGCGLRDWFNRRHYKFNDDNVLSGEAISHFGGMKKLLKRALACRHIVPKR